MSVERRMNDIVSGRVCFNVIYRKAELDGGYIAECLELPGCMAQGDTEGEVKTNIVDAIESCIAVLIQDRLRANVIDRDTDVSGVERRETLIFEPQVVTAA